MVIVSIYILKMANLLRYNINLSQFVLKPIVGIVKIYNQEIPKTLGTQPTVRCLNSAPNTIKATFRGR